MHIAHLADLIFHKILTLVLKGQMSKLLMLLGFWCFSFILFITKEIIDVVVILYGKLK